MLKKNVIWIKLLLLLPKRIFKATNVWFFACHFQGDPVMPGCLGLDAMWQLVGFYLCWMGGPGKGRALGVGEVKFTGQVLPTAKKVTYRINIKINSGSIKKIIALAVIPQFL